MNWGFRRSTCWAIAARSVARIEPVSAADFMRFLLRWQRNDKPAMLSYTDEATYRDAGQGGFEIRTFISIAAAAQGRGRLHYYRPIPIFAVGCTVATMSIDKT